MVCSRLPSLKAGTFLPHFDIFDGYSCPSQHQHFLIFPNKIQNTPAHVVRQKSTQILRHAFASYIALISTYTRLFPYRPRTQTGRCCYSRRPNANLLQSSLNAGDPVARRDGLVTLFVRYCTAKRSIVTCDSTFMARYLIFLSSVLLSWPLRGVAASLSTGLPTYYATYVQILM